MATLGIDIICCIAKMASPDDIVRIGAMSKWARDSLHSDIRDVQRERSCLIKQALRSAYHQQGGEEGMDGVFEMQQKLQTMGVSQLRAFVE